MRRKRDGKKQSHHLLRIASVGVVFAVVLVFYVIMLMQRQIVDRDRYISGVLTNGNTRTAVIPAHRGEIFDRNGKPLVTNEYKYSVVFDYGAMPYDAHESNSAILAAKQLLEDAGYAGNNVSTDSIFLGSYPNLIYDERKLADASYMSEFDKMLEAKKMDSDIRAAELAEYYVKRFALDDRQDGRAVYTADQVDFLIGVRYAMDLRKFSTAEPYVFAQDADVNILTYFEESNIRGVTIKTDTQRKYEYPGYASHILGRVGKIHAENWEYYKELGYDMDAVVGISGCEQVFEQYLHGTDGKMLIKEDENGNILSQKIIKEPIPGNDVWLTIDIDMQITAENALRENILYIRDKANQTAGALDGEDASAGAITAIGAGNGDVYVMASNPTYDLERFSEEYASLRDDELKPLLNRSTMGLYQPGSTFKVGVATAALEEKVITPNTTIVTKGRYTYYDENGPRCWVYLRNGGTHGAINVVGAIEVSCNYFFYDVGRRLTIEKMNEYSKKFGLGVSTGIELSEYVGILAGKEYRDSKGLEWYPGDTLQAAIGQSDNLFTPLQISCYIAMIANGGTRYSAHLLSSVRHYYTNEIIYEYTPVVLNEIEISDSTYSTICRAMKSVTEEGSAKRIFSKYPIAIGGKTGTAQVSEKKSDNAIFTAFAPYDTPEIVSTCIIEQGSNGTDAGITVKAIFDNYFGFEE